MLRNAAWIALLLALPATARQTDDETWARELVDSPHYLDDDENARAASWLELVEREPTHPLAEVTLQWLDKTPGQHPLALLERVFALDPSRFSPAAASALRRMQWTRATGREELTQRYPWLSGPAFGDCIAGGMVLGPLRDPLDWEARAKLLAAPGFEREHAGLDGVMLRWQPLAREGNTPWFDPDESLLAGSGWSLCAFAFDAPQGGPAWIEFDLRGDSGPAWIGPLSARDAGFFSQFDDPSLDLTLNEGAPQRIDLLTEERANVQLVPALLRAGANRLLVAVNLDARVRFTLRVLDPDGRPVPGFATRAATDAPGTAVAGAVPSTPFATSQSYLEQLPQRGPDTLALLAMSYAFDGRFTKAVQHFDEAVALAPLRVGPRMLLAEVYNSYSYLPDTWRLGRARALTEALAAEAPHHARVQLALARILAPEDREEEAIERLSRFGEAASRSPDVQLELASLYQRLDMEVPAERARASAARIAPLSPRVLNAQAKALEDAGLPQLAVALREDALRNGLIDAGDWRRVAEARAGLGEPSAEAAFQRAARLGGHNEQDALANYYEKQRRWRDADGVLQQLAERHPQSAYYVLRRADVARAEGALERERVLLENALARDVSNREARTRLEALGVADPAAAFLREWSVDAQRELQGFDAARWSDSVVRAIDASAVYVFADGAFEQSGHERDVARDLQGCESLGKQSPQGEMLRIVTIKGSDGREYEPVLVNGEYVMPALEPGDSVESVSHFLANAPQDGRIRIPRWYFASVEKPFHVSRYVISLPKSLGLKMVLSNFDGKYRVEDEGDREVHVFEKRDVARVVPEPMAPPTDWFLPWVEFGQDTNPASVEAELAREAVVPTRVTPEIAGAAATVIAGVEGQEARARALHTFAAQAIDKHSPGHGSAVAALLSREGNGAILFSALLDAVGIDNEIVWSRGVSPESDPDPDPAFTGAQRWMNQALVLVRPDDGPEAWCDFSSKTLPYDTLVGSAPRASAYATKSRRWTEQPDVPLAERPGERIEMTLRLAADRSAEIALDNGFGGNVGYVVKEQLREIPENQMKRIVTRIATQLVRGMDVAQYEVRHLQDDTDPVTIHVEGNNKLFLDQTGGEFACKLPLTALPLSSLASGEGRRELPFFLPSALVASARVRFELGDGLELADPFTDVRESFRGGQYVLAVEDASASGFTLVRELRLPPLKLAPEEFGELVSFARRVEEAERVRLRFKRVQ